MSGIAMGTSVLTRDGALPVEYLGLGDSLITRDAGFVPITAITAEHSTVRMVRIAAGSLGHTRPDEDMMVPWDQEILIRDWRARALYGTDSAMVPAHRLIDGSFVTDAGLQEVTVYQLHCDAAHVMYAGGLELACDVRRTVAA
ncbi:Hint domain-containing protein [Pseudaestuariivita sp.]|uniref:Hint domain-containing protein n=1 Tax=Pseudaestuariivita sp. TaxID=2211669 RepID=UPI0040585E10